MWKTILTAIASAALAVRAWAGGRLRAIEEARRIERELDAARAEEDRLGRELSRALAERRIEDAAALRRRRLAATRRIHDLAALSAAVAALALLCPACRSAAPAAAQPPPVVIGERVRALSPGESLTVPAPTPPARAWYLADDVGLSQWLGLDVDYAPETK